LGDAVFRGVAFRRQKGLGGCAERPFTGEANVAEQPLSSASSRSAPLSLLRAVQVVTALRQALNAGVRITGKTALPRDRPQTLALGMFDRT